MALAPPRRSSRPARGAPLRAARALRALQPVRRAISEAGPAPDGPRRVALRPAPGTAAGRVSVVVRLHGAPLAAYGGRSLAEPARTKLNTRSAASHAYLARLAAAQRTAAAQLTSARSPRRGCSQRYRVVLNGFTVELPARKLPKLLRLGFVAQVYPSVRYTLAHEPQPRRDRRGDVLVAARAPRRGDEDRHRRRRRRQHATRSCSGAGYSYPAGFPRGGQHVDERQGHRRARVPRPELGTPGTRGARPQDLVPRHARRRHRRRQRGHDRAGRPRPSGDVRASPASRRARGSATTASSTCRRRSATSRTPPRSSRRSRRPCRTGWT